MVGEAVRWHAKDHLRLAFISSLISSAPLLPAWAAPTRTQYQMGKLLVGAVDLLTPRTFVAAQYIFPVLVRKVTCRSVRLITI